MNHHANAPLGPEGRAIMVRRVLEEGFALTSAASAAEVSARPPASGRAATATKARLDCLAAHLRKEPARRRRRDPNLRAFFSTTFRFSSAITIWPVRVSVATYLPS